MVESGSILDNQAFSCDSKIEATTRKDKMEREKRIKNEAAASLGRMGGQKTLEKKGIEFYNEISRKGVEARRLKKIPAQQEPNTKAEGQQ